MTVYTISLVPSYCIRLDLTCHFVNLKSAATDRPIKGYISQTACNPMPLHTAATSLVKALVLKKIDAFDPGIQAWPATVKVTEAKHVLVTAHVAVDVDLSDKARTASFSNLWAERHAFR